jgi:hypothetical protein
MDPSLTEQVEQQRDLAFLEAFALGRDPPLRPTIQDLEHHAPQWATLIPDNPNLRAALAHFLGASTTLPFSLCRTSAQRWDWMRPLSSTRTLICIANR